MGMAATTTGMQMLQVQQAALLLCLVVLAASTRVALGNCRDDCMAACNGWTIVCQLSCASACYGEVGITTLGTSSAVLAKAEAPAASAPQAAQEGGGAAGVSMLRGLKRLSPPTRGRG